MCKLLYLMLKKQKQQTVINALKGDFATCKMGIRKLQIAHHGKAKTAIVGFYDIVWMD